jgi:16S rRNA processing protein RimM
VEAAPDNQPQAEDVVIARIIKPRGVRGEVACDIETDFPERFASLDQVTVWMPDESRLSLKLEDHWFHNRRVILKFEGFDTMTAAEELVGGRLVISEADTKELEEDEFYEYKIVGSEVVTTGGETLGRVTRLMRTGGADLLMIEGKDGREHLVPFVDGICSEVDASRGRITIDPPEGLLDL